MKKFKNIQEFENSPEFQNRDLSYCDLSNLDLSKFPPETWKNFKFFHTDFSNTNIVFKFYNLKDDDDNVTYCNFTNCDLSYTANFGSLTLEGCNFTNANMQISLPGPYVKNIIFPKCMEPALNEDVDYRVFDLDILRLNPHISFSSYFIYRIFKRYLPDADTLLTDKDIEFYLCLVDEILEHDRKREGKLYRLYQNLSKNFSDVDKIHFFQGLITNQTYDEIDLSFIDYRIAKELEFYNCQVNTVIVPDLHEGFDFSLDFYDKKYNYTRIPHLIIPSLKEDAWRSHGRKRVNGTSFTHQTNLYLELGRTCNAKCSFCRNQYLEPCDYDFPAIRYSLERLESHLNNVVIGGGEPTLRCVRDDLINLADDFRWNDFKFYLSTNGSIDPKELYGLSGFRILLSRHAVNDQDNNNVFGINTLTTSDITWLAEKLEDRITLIATCNKEGIATVRDVIDYIKFAQSCGVKNVLIQNLHEDLENDNTLQLDDDVFDEVISTLIHQGFKISDIPIYSTGDYKLVMLDSPNRKIKITIKKYLPYDIALKEWNRAAKRTFDLSMTPNGDVYKNWHQKNELILKR